MKNEIKRKFIMCLGIITVFFVMTLYAVADEEQEMEGNVYYFENTTYNAGHNDGYAKKKKIDQDDMHYGWVLGEFYLTGYTRQTTDENGNLVFLKTFGDDITLWYVLEQNINKLNGDKKLKINKDKKATDEHFGLKKTNFGKGTLIVQQTDYQNKVHEPVVYTDFLSAKVSQDAATEVEFLEEGDYEIALDYAIDNGHIIGMNKDYRWTFNFSIRNGNCMVFPKDVLTDSELTNTSITNNGFYLDLARSKYLEINITKEVYNEGANGLVEDVRFNRAAKDGDKYTDEGIYTIKVYNKYTDEQTIKKIYVGDNVLIKAHMNTGYSIDLIKSMLDEGWSISSAGNLISPTPTPTSTPTPTPTPTLSIAPTKNDSQTSNKSSEIMPSVVIDQSTSDSVSEDSIVKKISNLEEKSSNGNNTLTIIIVILGVLIVGFLGIVMYKKRRAFKGEKDSNISGKDENEEK